MKEMPRNSHSGASASDPGPNRKPGGRSFLYRVILAPLILLDWAGRFLLFVIARGWKLIISPWMPPACRFEPTCSEYAAETVKVHPFPKALVLVLWRVWRCSPAYDGGYDPVPARGQWPAKSLDSFEDEEGENEVEEGEAPTDDTLSKAGVEAEKIGPEETDSGQEKC